MRLDKYLKVSRLIKRRTLANEACDNGLVTVNGKSARASYDVKVGDVISLRFGVRTVTVEVLSVQETVRQADAAALYREVGQAHLAAQGFYEDMLPVQHQLAGFQHVLLALQHGPAEAGQEGQQLFPADGPAPVAHQGGE